jgi:hypothetical protein
MDATIMTVARLAAIKAVKREQQAQGQKPALIPCGVIKAAADVYLRAHPELIAQAAEKVRAVPACRKIAERHERARQRLAAAR